MKQVRIILFILATWGMIIGVPIVSTVLIKLHWPHVSWVLASAAGGIMFGIGILTGEWWARIMGGVIFKNARNPTKE